MAILMIIAKLIASSALLYAFYWFVLRNRATYTMARLYLLLIPFVSIAMSGLTLKVLPNSATTATPAVAPTPANEVTDAYWIKREGKKFKKVRVSQEELDEINKWHHQEQTKESPASVSFWQKVDGEALVLMLWAAVSFYITGSTFYKQCGDADELVENARKFHKQEQTNALILGYLKGHAHEEGCVMYYVMNEILPRDTILQLVPASVKNGRFKKFLAAKM